LVFTFIEYVTYTYLLALYVHSGCNFVCMPTQRMGRLARGSRE